jgi:hypothetical protein
MKPTRIRLSRKKGFSLQETSRKYNGLECVKVDRTNRFWGNLYVVGKHGTADECLELYKAYLDAAKSMYPEKWAIEIAKLKDKNLACWCSDESKCHVDILLKILEAEFSSAAE